jgi:cytochrome c556
MFNIFSLFLVLLTSACSSTQTTSVTNPDQRQPIAQHASYDSRLRELMDKIEILTQERFLTDHEQDDERRKYTQQIAINAEQLARSTDGIIAKLPSLGLSPQQQQSALSLAEKLREQSRQLQQQAQLHHIHAMSNHLQVIDTTCNACHALFKKLDR